MRRDGEGVITDNLAEVGNLEEATYQDLIGLLSFCSEASQWFIGKSHWSQMTRRESLLSSYSM